MATIQNPFRPGTGTMPAHIAGRLKERKMIDGALQSILADRDEDGLVPLTSTPQVIVGPRGVGKTVLLTLTMERASKSGIHVVELDEELLTGDEKNLKRAITPPGRLEKFKGYLKHFKGSFRVEDVFNFEVGPTGDLDPTDLRAILVAGALASPMAIFLDEAHTVPADDMRKFCKAAQSLIGRRYPLALVMAGTPGLRQGLRGIRATYMERSEYISLNLLTKEEAREALLVPAADTGVPMEDDALELLVEWTDCYPFFIQQAGRFSWEVAKGRGASRITIEDANEALVEAERLRQEFYDERYVELSKDELALHALQVIGLIEGQPGNDIGYKKLILGLLNANQGMVNKRAVEIYEALLALGFIHKNGVRYEAGIPSLFDYVKEQEAA